MDYIDDIKDVQPLTGKEDLKDEWKNLRRKTHQTIRKVTIDIEDRFHFNTAISAVMELINTLYQVQRPAASDKIALAAIREALETAIILLAPIVPHMTEELWEILGQRKPLSEVGWPEFDKSIASEEEITIVIQINGKLRSRMTVAIDEDAESIKAAAMADEKIIAMLKGFNILKVIYVPQKLVNIVAR
jgi:leucyl-tRNA synthetase